MNEWEGTVEAAEAWAQSIREDDVDLDDTEYTCGGCDKPQPSKPAALDMAQEYLDDEMYTEHLQAYSTYAIAEALNSLVIEARGIRVALEQGNAAAWNIRPGGK